MRPARGAASLLAALLVAACSNDMDKLFATRAAAADGAVDAAEPSADAAAPLTPYEQALRLVNDGDACRRCMDAMCDTQARTCAGDPECMADVECELDCRDPVCHATCGSEFPLGGRPSSDLEKCAVESCAEQCRIGRDFSCVGDWKTRPEAAATVLKLQLGDLSPGPLLEAGLRVRVCPRSADPDCTDPTSTTLSDANGQVEVRLPSDGGDNKGYVPFPGFIALDDPDRDPPRILPTLLFVELPWKRSYPYPIDTLLFTPSQTAFVSAAYFLKKPAPERMPDTGVVGGVVFDCRSSNEARSVGLTAELSPAPEATIVSPSASMTSGFFTAVNVAPGVVTITLKDEDRVVAQRSVPVVADKTTYLWLMPSTSAQ